MLGVEPGVKGFPDEAATDEIARDEVGGTDGAGVADCEGPAFDWG